MTIDNFLGYKESADLSKIPPGYLAYPSANVLVTKGKVITRGGLVNDGVASTVDEAVHSEFVWKDAPGGERFLRVYGNTLQVKHLDKWVTIFTGLDADTTRVFFDTWIDSNTTVIKKRLFFCDGSTNLYQWNGLIATVESWSDPAITVEADRTNLGLMGADAGDVTAQTVTIYSLDGDGEVDDSEEETYSDDPVAGLVITLDSAPGSFTPAAGDLVISNPTTVADAISATYNIDIVYDYQNHLIVAQYDDVSIHFSHVVTYVLATGLDFTQPVAASRTAVTAIYLQLEGGFQAMISRKGVLWVSDDDDWYKVTKTIEKNAYDLWVDVEKFETGENKGALPMAVAKHKGDIIYMAQDLTLQRITTIDVIGKDDILLLSDDVEAMFRRLDNAGVRLYYYERGIYIIFPAESTLVILDTAEQAWYYQPPQTIPINCMSVVDGIKYGHHNGKNETYQLFSGRNDLGAASAEAVIATGYLHNTASEGNDHFKYKSQHMFGLDCRLTDSTKVSTERLMEEEGDKGTTTFDFTGKGVKKFSSDDDVSWASHPYGSRAWAGADMEVAEIKRAFVFDKERNDGHFEVRPIITISGSESEFHLLGIYMDEKLSKRVIGNGLFVNRS